MSSNSSAPISLDTAMFIISMAQFAISAIGLPMNSFLIFCMLKNKALRATCCTIFILLLAFDDWLCEFLILIGPTVLVLLGTPISLSACFPFGILSYFANSYAQSLIFFISVDRLISILFPLAYEKFANRHKWNYIFILASIPLLWMSAFIYISYLGILADPNRQVFCMPTDPISPWVNSINFYMVSFFNVTAFLIYSCIWMLIKCKVIKLLQNSLEQRVLHSLFVLMSIVFFFGVPAPISANFLFPYLQISPAAQNVAFRGLLQLNKIVQTVNAPILFLCSHDFNAVMKRELAKIFGRVKTKRIANGSRSNTNGNGQPAINNLIGN